MSARQWIARTVSPSNLIGPKVRKVLLRWGGVQVASARIYGGGQYAGDLRGLKIGNGVFLNTGVAIFPTGGVIIEDNVAIGPYALIMTGTHDIGGPERRASSATRFAPVRVGEGSWIGARTVIQGGVTIGPGCVIAAGSVVVSDCEENAFYAGVPAVLKRTLPAR